MSTPINHLGFLLTVLTLVCIFPQPASAYLDPSTGSFAIQGALGSVFAILFYSRTAWNRLKSFNSLSAIKGFAKHVIRP